MILNGTTTATHYAVHTLQAQPRKEHHATAGLDETKLAFQDSADKEYPFSRYVYRAVAALKNGRQGREREIETRTF